MDVEYRTLRKSDYDNLREAMILSYSALEDSYWDRAPLEYLIDNFPEGQFVALNNRKIVGACLSIRLAKGEAFSNHTFKSITANYSLTSHNSSGNILYGIEVFVLPGYRRQGIAKKLYKMRRELCETANLEGIVFGGRIPGYKQKAQELSAENYVKEVIDGKLHDPTMSFHLQSNFKPVRLIPKYLEGDIESKEFALLYFWPK